MDDDIPKYEVHADGPEQAINHPSLPAIGSPCPHDSDKVLIAKQATPHKSEAGVWVVTLEWSDQNDDPSDGFDWE